MSGSDTDSHSDSESSVVVPITLHLVFTFWPCSWYYSYWIWYFHRDCGGDKHIDNHIDNWCS